VENKYMTRFIREGRFGPPKSFKTGAVVGTYPRPLLVLSFDVGGTDIIREPITFIPHNELNAVCALPSDKISPLSVVDLSSLNNQALTSAYQPVPDTTTFPATISCVNALTNRCPWKTVVIDTVTGLSDCIWGHQSATNAPALADPRKWAGNIGMKVKQVIDRTNQIQAHTVFIFHSEVIKDETTSAIGEQPMVYSKLRDCIGGLFSQFFYAFTDVSTKGQPQAWVRTQPFGLIKGIGVRWPADLPNVCGATFQAIYGKSNVV
jgi:hypothetical protein